jgi:hypothetical protein
MRRERRRTRISAMKAVNGWGKRATEKLDAGGHEHDHTH